jgi:hypothetical protein
MTDTLGKALIAYLDGGTAIHEIERDDGRVETTDTGWYFTPRALCEKAKVSFGQRMPSI